MTATTNQWTFCGIVDKNEQDSDVPFLRCKSPLLKFNREDSETRLLLTKKLNPTKSSTLPSTPHGKPFQLAFSPTVPKSRVEIVVNNDDSFIIPSRDCTKGLVKYKHQFRPKAHQTALLKKIYPRCFQIQSPRSKHQSIHSNLPFLIYWAMGSGKTKGILNCLRYVTPESTIDVIVVCPKSCVLNWCNEIRSLSFHPDADKDLYTVFNIVCESQLKKKLEQDPTLFRDKIVIYDEVQLLRNLTTDQQWIINQLRWAPIKFLLTGTPVMNSENEITYLCRIADPSIPTETPYATYKLLFPRLYANNVHYFDPKNTEVLQATEPKQVPMTLYQTFKYFECRSNTTKIGGLTIQTSTHNSYDILQKVNSVYVCDDHSPKIDALIQDIRAFGKFPQIVHSQFVEKGLVKIKEKLQRAFPTKRVEIFHGNLSNTAREQLLSDFNKQKIPLLAFSKCGGLGVNLTYVQKMHNLEPFDNVSTRDQTIARCLRINSYALPCPSPDMNTFLTETTYVSTFPSKRTISSNDNVAKLDRDIQRYDPFYFKQFPSASERKKVFVKFLKDEIKASRFQTVDQKIHSRMFLKQQGIESANSTIMELGHDPYIDELIKQKECRKCYREKAKEKSKQTGTSSTKCAKIH